MSEALRSVGINIRITETHDLYAGGKKVSGNAFCFRRNKVVHHGTLLVSADLPKLKRLLSPPELSIETHAVRSNPAETVNLESLGNGITPEALISGMTKAYLGGGTTAETISHENFRPDELGGLTERNRAWEWNFGRTPDFKINILGFAVSIRKGLIDAVEGAQSEALEPLIGMPLRKDDLRLYLDAAAAAGEAEAVIAALHSISV